MHLDKPQIRAAQSGIRRHLRAYAVLFSRATFGATPPVLIAIGLATIVLVVGCQAGSPSIFAPLERSTGRYDLQRGQDLLAKKDVAGAIGAFESAVRHDSKNSAAQAELGRLRADQGDLEGAANCYREALHVEPDRFDYAFALAEILRRQAETSTDRDCLLRAAIRAYAHAQWINPQHAVTTARLVECFEELGQDDAAAAAFLETLRATPQAALIHTRLAAEHYARGDWSAALAEYGRALELDPSDAVAHNGWAVAHLRLAAEQGQAAPLARRRAVAHLRKSLALNPEQPRVAALLATLEQKPAIISQTAGGEAPP
jgi:tetratricopeptide (TPR) repeat protein